jgi:hypothetical protein
VVTILSSWPDGNTRTFADDAELKAWRTAILAAETPLERGLRECRDELIKLNRLAKEAQLKRDGRREALQQIASRLNGLIERIAPAYEQTRRELVKRVPPP